MAKLTTSNDISDFLASANDADAIIELGAAPILVAISHTLSSSSDFPIPLPTNGLYIGEKALYHIRPTAPTNLTNDNNILIPSDSYMIFPKTLTQDKTYIVQLMWDGSAWMLVTLVGGYA